MGELDLDKIERLWGPGQETEHPREKRPLVVELEIIDDELPPPRRDGCQRLLKARK